METLTAIAIGSMLWGIGAVLLVIFMAGRAPLNIERRQEDDQ